MCLDSGAWTLNYGEFGEGKSRVGGRGKAPILHLFDTLIDLSLRHRRFKQKFHVHFPSRKRPIAIKTRRNRCRSSQSSCTRRESAFLGSNYIAFSVATRRTLVRLASLTCSVFEYMRVYTRM